LLVVVKAYFGFATTYQSVKMVELFLLLPVCGHHFELTVQAGIGQRRAIANGVRSQSVYLRRAMCRFSNIVTLRITSYSADCHFHSNLRTSGYVTVHVHVT
jgi:hypothetical protein